MPPEHTSRRPIIFLSQTTHKTIAPDSLKLIQTANLMNIINHSINFRLLPQNINKLLHLRIHWLKSLHKINIKQIPRIKRSCIIKLHAAFAYLFIELRIFPPPALMAIKHIPESRNSLIRTTSALLNLPENPVIMPGTKTKQRQKPLIILRKHPGDMPCKYPHTCFMHHIRLKRLSPVPSKARLRVSPCERSQIRCSNP